MLFPRDFPVPPVPPLEMEDTPFAKESSLTVRTAFLLLLNHLSHLSLFPEINNRHHSKTYSGTFIDSIVPRETGSEFPMYFADECSFFENLHLKNNCMADTCRGHLQIQIYDIF